MDGKVQKFFENATTYFSKVTEQNLYRYQNVLEYVDGEYQITNKITDKNLQEMRANMDEADVAEFDAFVEKYWGDQIRREKMQREQERVSVSVGEDVSSSKRRGRKPKIEE